MAQARVPYLLGHAEIASLFQIERQTSQKWRAEGTLPEPDLVASGNPYWLLTTVLSLGGGGDRQVDGRQLDAYKAAISHGYVPRVDEQLPVIIGIQEVARVLGRDAQAVSRWRNRRRIAEPDLVLSGSPLWLLETLIADAHQRQRSVVPAEIALLRAGQRAPQKPRGRRSGNPTVRPPKAVAPAARTFTSDEQATAVEFLESVLTQGYAVVIKPQT
ncbi:hypothetical protein ABZ135_03260 [Streptomyces sp. NPDC006339]|uniref:hypothetical protein n=1 Tax=Streptomyces sp. NPDC006339 TaxID=3156755 RepID=UPI0033A5949C